MAVARPDTCNQYFHARYVKQGGAARNNLIVQVALFQKVDLSSVFVTYWLRPRTWTYKVYDSSSFIFNVSLAYVVNWHGPFKAFSRSIKCKLACEVVNTVSPFPF